MVGLKDFSTLVHMIVDCQKFVPVIIPDNEELLRSIEVNSRILCYKLHLKRLYLYNIIKEASGVGMAADQSWIIRNLQWHWQSRAPLQYSDYTSTRKKIMLPGF